MGVGLIKKQSLGGKYQGAQDGTWHITSVHAAQDALDMSLRLALSIPLPDIMAFRKVCCACRMGHIRLMLPA